MNKSNNDMELESAGRYWSDLLRNGRCSGIRFCGSDNNDPVSSATFDFPCLTQGPLRAHACCVAAESRPSWRGMSPEPVGAIPPPPADFHNLTRRFARAAARLIANGGSDRAVTERLDPFRADARAVTRFIKGRRRRRVRWGRC